jgi:hypothetical protein
MVKFKGWGTHEGAGMHEVKSLKIEILFPGQTLVPAV